MFDASGHRRKLVIFTEHRDTLNYLTERIRTMLGREEAVVNIHGGMGREERRKAQEAFTQDKSVQVLVATDAAGEGINLQRAHLTVNYDLPKFVRSRPRAPVRQSQVRRNGALQRSRWHPLLCCQYISISSTS